MPGVILAVFLGALFHNFVDSFTHESGAAVSFFPSLGSVTGSLNGEPLHVFRILQYSGSILGMVMLFVAYAAGLRRYCRATESRFWQDLRRWLQLFTLVVATILLAVALNVKVIPGAVSFYQFRAFGFKFLITWLPIIGLTLLCFGLLRSRPR